MPRFNFYLILFAILAYLLTAQVTLRDRLLVSALHRIERNAYFEPSSKELFEGAMFGMMDVLADKHGDEHSLYVPSSRQAGYQDNLDNRYEGLGVLVRAHEKEGEEKKLFIDFPFHASPAYRAGLRSGDQILQIDGVPVVDKTDSDIFRLLRQQRNTATHLFVLPFDQSATKDFFVRRERIHYDSVVGDFFNTDGRVFCLEIHPKIGYIWITSFGTSTAKEFGNALDAMMQCGVEAFILDLRDNGGGDLWNCILAARMLLSSDSEQKVIVTVRPRNGRERSNVLTKGSQRCTLPMVVLINGDTASSSEILAAALQDHRRAVIVGTRSFGKGVIQGIIALPFQSGILQLTDAEYRRPNGGAIHRKKNAADSDDWGVIPDNIVAISEAEQLAMTQYRLLRSNVISTERSAVLDQFRQQIIETQSREHNTGTSEQPFEFTGTPPYYDPQLDEAIKILLGTSND
jgi:carboxyl-terminal processing protease